MLILFFTRIKYKMRSLSIPFNLAAAQQTR
jgi:hypothetical protein